MTYEIVGADRLRATLRSAGRDLNELKTAPAAAARIVAGAARAPVRSGRLQSSISSTASANLGTVTASAPYAGVIHWGWPRRNIRPQPFLSDAATSSEPTWIQEYENEIDKVIDQVQGA